MLVLLDNGSLRPDAVIALRALAAGLAARLGEPVAPVSLLHSGKIDPAELGGEPADTLGPFLRRRARAGVTDFRILPLFIGPSSAIVDYLPERIAAARAEFPALRVEVAPVLAADAAGEAALAGILADHAREAAEALGGADAVIVCDHGSPCAAVTAVRDRLAARLGAVSAFSGVPVRAASMERRPEPEYDFNEPLLPAALHAAPAGRVVVAPAFLLPGRHAGEGGDVATMCAEAEAARPGLVVRRARLLAEHPALLELLVARAR